MAKIKDKLYARAAQQKLPLTGAFELSPVCNFKCSMCYVRKSMGEVQTQGGLRGLDFWLDVAEQAREAGTLYPLLTGGEPFLYPHFRELFQAMCRMGMQVSINSNASCITEREVEWLTATPPERINVTLYGATNASYGRLCGDEKGFDKVMRGVELLRENKIRFKFNCSLTPENVGELEQMVAVAREFDLGLKAASYMFPPVRRTGQCGDYAQRLSPRDAAYYQVMTDFLQLPPEQFQRLAGNMSRFVELTPERIAEAEGKEPRAMGCLAGRCSYWVDWQGNLSACGVMDVPQLSLRELSLREAWDQVTAWAEGLRYSSACGNCVNRGLCFSCAAMVRNETGSFQGRPVYLCETRQYAARFYREFAEKHYGKFHSPEEGSVLPPSNECALEEL